MAASELHLIKLFLGYSNIKNITVFPCNAIGNRLYIQHGKEYKMFVEFVSKQTSEVTQLKPTLHGKIGKNWLALPLDDEYTEILKKPLKEGAVHTYEMTFPILRGYPLVSS